MPRRRPPCAHCRRRGEFRGIPKGDRWGPGDRPPPIRVRPCRKLHRRRTIWRLKRQQWPRNAQPSAACCPRAPGRWLATMPSLPSKTRT